MSIATLRSTTATYTGPDFNIHTAPAGVVRYDYSSGQTIRNPHALNAVAGTPGTPPTFWYVVQESTGTMAQEIVGSGAEIGPQGQWGYVDVRFFGTPAAAGSWMNIAFEANAILAAVQGQQVSSAVSVRLVAGSTANLSGVRLAVQGTNATGAGTETPVSAFFPPASAGISGDVGTRLSFTTTLGNSATTGASFYLQAVGAAANVPIDVTLRISGPVLALGSTVPALAPFPPHVVNEAAATNLLPQSIVSGWSAGAMAITPNAATAPDGTNTAALLTETTANSQHIAFISASASFAIGETVTFSVYLMADGSSVVGLTEWGEGDASFNLATGVASAGGSCISAMIVRVTGSWFRCSATFVRTNTGPEFYISASGSFANYAGNTTTSVYAWGAQVETGAVATSYIPTSGVVAIRAADALFTLPAPPRLGSPVYAAGDFLAAMQGLLPTGPVWPRDADAVQTQALAALMPTYVRQNARAANLLIDAFPIAPIELLPEWEETLGLPDPCAGPSPTQMQRQQQVNARFVASGGQSIDYFVDLAANLGYPVTITQFTPFQVGQPIDQPLYGEAWAFAWQVNAPTFNIEYFTVGRDTVGEPLTQWGNAVLQCEIQRLAPAHTTILFSY